jgi:cysteine desulfurase
MGIPAETAQGSLIFTLGIENTKEDVELALEVLPPVVEKLRRISPLYSQFIKTEPKN